MRKHDTEAEIRVSQRQWAIRPTLDSHIIITLDFFNMLLDQHFIRLLDCLHGITLEHFIKIQQFSASLAFLWQVEIGGTQLSIHYAD